MTGRTAASAPPDRVLFALESSRPFGEAVADHLGAPLAAHEEREFEDGEHKARPLVSVRGKDVYVVAGLHGEPDMSVNDKLLRLFFFVGALKDARAARVTAVVPYLAYARKDRKTKSRDPVTTRYVATLFEAVGTDCVVTIDVHNLAAFQNAYRCATEHLTAANVFADYTVSHLSETDLVVVSPDAGGVKRAEHFRQVLSARLDAEVPFAWLEKTRSEGVVRGQSVVGTVRNRTAILLDDLISTGTTLARAATTCRAQGATKVWAAATHGLFTGNAADVLAEPALDTILVTNTVPARRLSPSTLHAKVVVLDVSPLLASTIHRLHTNEPITELLEPA